MDIKQEDHVDKLSTHPLGLYQRIPRDWERWWPAGPERPPWLERKAIPGSVGTGILFCKVTEVADERDAESVWKP